MINTSNLSTETKGTKKMNTDTQPNRRESIAQATDFIIENDTWMLTTCGSDHIIRSRPMLNVNKAFDGDVYLFAHADDKVLHSIRENPQVNIVICEPSNQRYASITGKAQVIDNAKKSEILWNERCAVYFELKQPSDEIALVKIDVDDVEYWDAEQSIMTKLGKFFQMSSAGLSEAEIDHQQINWS